MNFSQSLPSGGLRTLVWFLLCFGFGFGGMATRLEAAKPSWTVDMSQFQYNMSINAEVQFDAQALPTGDHLLGAFVGNTCRGTASPQLINGKIYFFLMIYANMISGEQLTLKLYHAGEDVVLNALEQPTFQRNQVLGTVMSPYQVHFADQNDFPIEFLPIGQQNTISGTPFPVLDLNDYLLRQDQDLIQWELLQVGNRISASLSQTGALSAHPLEPQWTGMDSVQVWVHENGPKEFSDTVWIYFNILPFKALQWRPLPTQKIGSDDEFKIYDVDAYLLPTEACRNFSLRPIPLKGDTLAPNWIQAPGGGGSMSLNAKVTFGGVEQYAAGSQLAVFINNELRGVASPTLSGGSYWYFIIVNNGTAGKITFKYYDSANAYIYECPTNHNFVSNSILGSVMEPYEVKLEPVLVQINAEGTLSATVQNPDWTGKLSVEISAKDCQYPDINSALDTACFIIDPNDTGAPVIFSATRVSFTETSCLPLYDTDAFDQKDREGNGLTYRIAGGPDAAFFEINANTGQLKWKNTPDFEQALDQEENNTYELWIEVSDQDAKTQQITLSIQVLDNPQENFVPQIRSSGFLCDPKDQTRLSASAGQYFLWSTGEILSEITVDEAGIYTVTITDALGCKDTLSQNIIAITFDLAQDSACVNASALALAGGVPVGGQYLGAGINNNTFDPASAGVGKHLITYHYSSERYDCVKSLTDTFYVLPVPQVSDLVIDTICSDSKVGQPFPAGQGVVPATYELLALTSNGVSIAGGSPILGKGLSAADLVDDVYTNKTNEVQTVVYRVVPFSAQGCPGDTFQVMVPVSPEPVISALDKGICNAGNTTLNLNNDNNLAFTQIKWSANYLGATGGLGTGLTSPGVAALAEVLENPGTTPIPVHYTLVPYQSKSGCLGDTLRVKITLNPRPTMKSVADQSLCNGGQSLPINFVSEVNGTVFSWVNDNTTLGLAAAGAGSIDAFVSPKSTQPKVAQIRVRPSYSNAGVTCYDSVVVFKISTINCEPTIADPCTCVNNSPEVPNGSYTNAGTFAEAVAVTAPSGQIWKVIQASGMFSDTAGSTPIAPGTLLIETPALSGNYEIHGFHHDSIGYRIKVANTQLDTLEIGNVCYYPDPVFSGLPPIVSPDAAALIVKDSVRHNPTGVGIFFLDDVPQVKIAPNQLKIEPRQLSRGQHTLRYRFDAGAPKGGDPQDPGCVQEISQRFEVADCSCKDIVVQLDEQCQFRLLASMISNGNCSSGIVKVQDNQSNNGDLIDCAGVWTYGLFDSFGNILCWGKVTAEDKRPPAIVCESKRTSPLWCFEVESVMNNPLTIGHISSLKSPVNPQQTLVGHSSPICPTGPESTDRDDDVCNLGRIYFRDNCANCSCQTRVTWSDRVVYYSCDSIKAGKAYAAIYRQWTATDCNGISRDSTQRFRFIRPSLDTNKAGALDSLYFSVESGAKNSYTKGYDFTVAYNSCGADKSIIDNRDVFPKIAGLCDPSHRYYLAPNGTVGLNKLLECNYSVSIQDTELPICDGKGLKIHREIKIFDWCENQVVKTFYVLIKIGDFAPPTLAYTQQAPFEISTGPSDCTAAVPATVMGIKTALGVEIKDNCTVANTSVVVKTRDRYVKGILVAPNAWDKVEYTIVNGTMIGVPVGEHRMIIDMFDACYNTKRDSFNFFVKDQIAPVMKCDDQLRVSLSSTFGYPDNTGKGSTAYAQLSAQDLDEGSLDNCQLSWMRVRRSVSPDCLASFVLKGYDTNGDGQITPRSKSYGEAPDAKVDADKVDGFDLNGDGDIADFGEAFEVVNGILFSPLGDRVEFFCCDIQQVPVLELWGEDHSGNRNYCWTKAQLEDKTALTCQAPWDLTIDCDDKCLNWLSDTRFETQADQCFGGTAFLTSGGDCAPVQKVYSVSTVKGKCGVEKYIRKWVFTKTTGTETLQIECTQTISLRNFHQYNIRFPKDDKFNCNQGGIVDTLEVRELNCDVLALNVSDKRYAASEDECYKIFRTYTVVNWCAYNDRCGDPAQNVHVVPRTVFDNNGKTDFYVLVRDEDRTGEEHFWYSRDSVFNPKLDQAFIPTIPSANGPTTTGNRCEGEYFHAFQYTQIIKVYDNESPVIKAQAGAFCIQEGADCLANTALEITVEDNCLQGKIELETNLMGLELEQNPGVVIPYQPNRWTITPTELVPGLKLNEGIAPARFKITIGAVPEGKHHVIVVARDECGNLSTATRIPLDVKDCKGPAPICINGLSVELMPSEQNVSQATVWASDLVASKVFDCNGQGPEMHNGLKLVTHYSINRVGEAVVPNQNKLSFGCDDARLGIVPIEIHAWDTRGNHDFCVSFVEIQDQQGNCANGLGEIQISGTITTDEAEPVQGVKIELSGGADFNRSTNSEGGYQFIKLKPQQDYTLSAQLDENPLNGVSTLDLIYITRHILGIKPIETPTRLIAADVNNSKSITTLDIVLIRKLILGLDTRFAHVPSWRFVDAKYVFPQPGHPWADVFPEIININNLEQNAQADFVAIKMGDVNGSVLLNGRGNPAARISSPLKRLTQEQPRRSGKE